jgi:mannose-6-phosphate isomerase-like protein (cupin superfamily)
MVTRAAEGSELPWQDKERFHRDAEARVQSFKAVEPDLGDTVKDVSVYCRTDLLKVLVQTIKTGGENNLHYHTNADTFWLVLRGRARFYGVEEKLIGEYGPHEGVLLPGGTRYWFEQTGSETLEILQIIGLDKSKKGQSERIDLGEQKSWMSKEFFATGKIRRSEGP